VAGCAGPFEARHGLVPGGRVSCRGDPIAAWMIHRRAYEMSLAPLSGSNFRIDRRRPGSLWCWNFFAAATPKRRLEARQVLHGVLVSRLYTACKPDLVLSSGYRAISFRYRSSEGVDSAPSEDGTHAGPVRWMMLKRGAGTGDCSLVPVLVCLVCPAPA
jgi:hypothetical protein